MCEASNCGATLSNMSNESRSPSPPPPEEIEEANQDEQAGSNEQEPQSERIIIYVGNMNYRTGEDTLRARFEPYGHIYSCKVAFRDGRSLGYGFVEMDKEEADKAIAELSEQDLEGRRMKVEPARDNASRGGDSRPPRGPPRDRYRDDRGYDRRDDRRDRGYDRHDDRRGRSYTDRRDRDYDRRDSRDHDRRDDRRSRRQYYDDE